MSGADAITRHESTSTRRAPETTSASRLPELGRRGGGWVVMQVAFLAAAVAAGVLGAAWPPAASPWLAAAGCLAALAGVGLLVGGGAGLGRQLTPFPAPVPDGELRQSGVYRLVRHPMYGGALLAMLAWALLSSPLALLPLGLAAAFLDAKRRREEAWLLGQHPAYAEYRQRVTKRFIPLVW
jgi:protein-S-isoprenylcysteine O-methyltransferase Ste14